MIINLGLCMSRHAMPREVRDYIFPTIVDDVMNFDSLYQKTERELNYILSRKGCLDSIDQNPDGSLVFEVSKETELHVYVTGMTPCLVSVINYCLKYKVKLVCYHYDTSIQDYRPQKVNIKEKKK